MKKIIDTLPGSIEFSHIGYIVDDRDRYIEGFAGNLGIDDFLCYEYAPDKAFCDEIPLEDCRLRLALGQSEKYGIAVELIEPKTGETPHKRCLEELGSCLNHIAFRVSDYDAYREAFSRIEGSRIIFEADFTDDIKGRRRSFYITAPSIPGVLEITEIPQLKSENIGHLINGSK